MSSSTIKTSSEPVASPNRRSSTNAKKLYVLLCSPAHSGSTLIACLGAAHPQISTVGEFSVLFERTGPCSCRKPYIECEYWQRWIELAFDAGIQYTPGSKDFYVGPDPKAGRFARLYHHHFSRKTVDRFRDSLLRHTSYHRFVERKTHNVVRMAQLLCDAEGTSTFLDTSKNGLLVRPLLEQNEIDVRVISLVRDGRAAVLSLMKWYNYSLSEAVDRWLSQIRLTLRSARYASPDQVLHLRHEDFVRNQQSMVPRLYRFCGVDPNAKLDYSGQRRHIVGNTMRHTFDGTIRIDDSWRDKITLEQLRYFNRRAGWVNRSLGYED
jgi:Sulfotransferase family